MAENDPSATSKSSGAGLFLFAAGESSGKLAAYGVDGESGRLMRLETYEVGRMPWWVLAVNLPAAANRSGEKPGGKASGKPVKDLILPGESFLVEGRPAFVLLPPEEKRTKPQPWVLYAPTLPGLPDRHERWMHERFLDAGVAEKGLRLLRGHPWPDAPEVRLRHPPPPE